MSKFNSRLTSAFAAILAATLTVVTSAVPEAVQARSHADCTRIAAQTGTFVRA